MFKILDPISSLVSQAIADGIRDHNANGQISRENFAVAIYNGEELTSGVTASVSFGVLFINNIWVADGFREAGFGRQLMTAAEDEGRKRGALTACVDTLSTQAPKFYEKLNYREFGRLTGQVAGSALHRIWFQKTI